MQWCQRCLLYTSDAADDHRGVDLGGRRIIKKIFFFFIFFFFFFFFLEDLRTVEYQRTKIPVDFLSLAPSYSAV
jgi:hypothetical protein